MSQAYSQYKMLHYLPMLEEVRDGGMMVPPHIEINPVNFCNHDCYFCSYRAQGDERLNALFEEKQMLRTDDVMRILKEAADCGVRAVQYCGGGEPTLHPDFKDIVRRTQVLDMKSALVSNGTGIDPHDEEWIELLSNMSWVRLSIDAATVDTYQKIHVHRHALAQKHFQNAWDVIEAISSSVLSDTVEVGVSFIITPLNWQDAVGAVKMAKTAGADNIRVGAEVYTDGRGPTLADIEDQIAVELDIARGYADDEFDVIVQAPERMRNLMDTQYEAGEACWHHHAVGIIGADGNLYSCCIKKYCTDGLITSVLDKPLLEAFTGEDHRAFGQRLNPQVDCTHGCFLKPKNDVVAAALGATSTDDPPKHVEFV